MLGSVDGVGFSENKKDTISKMLDEFDDFFQIYTLFKIPLFLHKEGIINSISGVSLDASFFDEEAINYFESTYFKPYGLINYTGTDISKKKSIIAGKAHIVLS